MADVIPFNVSTAAAVASDDSHAEEVPTVVPVDIPLTTLRALREDLDDAIGALVLARDYIDDHQTQTDDEVKTFAVVLGILVNIGPMLALRSAARSPPIPA